MGSLRATLRAATLLNKFLGYIVTVILSGYAKADLGKEIKITCEASITMIRYFLKGDIFIRDKRLKQ